MSFFRARPGFRFDATGYTLLAVDAPPLSLEDGGRPLLVLDATWRLLPRVAQAVEGLPIRRSIPEGVQTAYPRVGTYFPDPQGGLASVEALYVARALLGDNDPTLLAGYHWKAQFLESLPGWDAFKVSDV
jgi:pre-rRNA-processing protein TSR3